MRIGSDLWIADTWEEREPTNEELVYVRSKELRRELRTQKYWAIKKPNERFRRSSDHLKREVGQLINGSVEHTRYDWSKFVTDVMTIALEARVKGESVVWMCDFTRLYNGYLLKEKKSTVDCPLCSGFDEYLNREILSSRDWQRCKNGKNESKPWCMAYRRFVRSENFNKNPTKKYRASVHRSELYLKDVEILMRWLSMKISSRKCNKNETILMTLPYDPYRPPEKKALWIGFFVKWL